MITEFLLDAFEGLVSWIQGLLPAWDQDPFATWGTVLSHLADLNYYLPISEVFSFTLAVVFLAPVLLGINLFVWFIALIRGGSARG